MCIVKKTWTSEFKLALINEDIASLEKLLDSIDYKEVDLNEAKALTQEAIKLISKKKDAQATEIQKIQKARKYIKA